MQNVIPRALLVGLWSFLTSAQPTAPRANCCNTPVPVWNPTGVTLTSLCRPHGFISKDLSTTVILHNRDCGYWHPALWKKSLSICLASWEWYTYPSLACSVLVSISLFRAQTSAIQLHRRSAEFRRYSTDIGLSLNLRAWSAGQMSSSDMTVAASWPQLWKVW